MTLPPPQTSCNGTEFNGHHFMALPIADPQWNCYVCGKRLKSFLKTEAYECQRECLLSTRVLHVAVQQSENSLCLWVEPLTELKVLLFPTLNLIICPYFQVAITTPPTTQVATSRCTSTMWSKRRGTWWRARVAAGPSFSWLMM